MAGRMSPAAVLREGPRALSDDQVREIEDSALTEVLHVDVDDVIEYVHKDLKSLPDFTTLYRRYLKQRWDVYDLDFSQDKVDWREKMTGEERQSFIAVAAGFHHGARQVQTELPVFMIGASEEAKRPWPAGWKHAPTPPAAGGRGAVCRRAARDGHGDLRPSGW